MGFFNFLRRREPTIEELEAKLERLRREEEALRRKAEHLEKITEIYERAIPRRHSQMRVVSTEKVVCRAKKGEIHNAILLIHEDGTIGMKCSGKCLDCEYEDVLGEL